MEFENRVIQKVGAVYFTALAAMMYYFLEDTITIGLPLTTRHFIALLIIFSAFFCFLIKPELARGAVSVRTTLAFCLPLFIMVLFSLVVWVVEKTDMEHIRRSLSYSFIFINMFHAVFAAGALLYMFGSRGIWYNLAAILMANLLMIFSIIRESGLGTFLSEFAALIRSFSAESGAAIQQAEIHELAFCLGAYLVYMMVFPKKKLWFWILFSLSAFCFLAAFKRIAIVAILTAVGAGWLLRLLERYGRKHTVYVIIQTMMLAAVVILFCYIGLIRAGIFEDMERGGINTNGRAEIYKAVEDYYEFTPGYLGKGLNFLVTDLNLNPHSGIVVAAIHNDFLEYYVNLGFWGYIIWLLALTAARTHYFCKKGGTDNGIAAAVMLIYIIIASSTDNTMLYPLVTTTTAIITIGHGYDGQAEEFKEKFEARTGLDTDILQEE